MTGSLNAAAAEWLIATGRTSAPYVAAQGTAMGRRGCIHVSEDGGKLWIGGKAEVILSGSASI